MQSESLAAYDAVRDLNGKPFRAVCYAPFTSMFLDTFGHVRACCVNRRYVLGDLKSQRIDDIWFGERFRKLRDAMKRYDLRLGCEHCQWQVDDGNFSSDPSHYSSLHAFKYDRYAIDERDALWPTNLEFNLSNTCNLECVMCSGEFSSSIRSRREKLPPLPRPYGDSFFEDIRKYIPHIKTAQFLGGEPFLVNEHFRIWEMMIEDQAIETLVITTNGTIYNPRVERILESLPVWICMSIDGATKETFEKIRVNAVFEVFLENFSRFLRHAQGRGRNVSFNFTLSRLNWHEFADLLLFAEDHGCPVGVCTLVGPEEFSLYTLPAEELRRMVQTLETRDGEMAGRLRLNRTVWQCALENLRHRISNDVLPVLPLASNRHWEQFRTADLLTRDEERRRDADAALAMRTKLGVDASVVATDEEDRIVEAEGDVLGSNEAVLGKHLDEIFELLVKKHGSDVRIIEVAVDRNRAERIVEFRNAASEEVAIHSVAVPRFEGAGRVIGITTFIARGKRIHAAMPRP